MARYSDLDYQFIKNPKSKDVYKHVDQKAIEQSLKNLFKTNKGERLFQPEIGANIKALLFQSDADLGEIETMKESLKSLIRNFEPRILLEDLDIDFQPDKNEINISVKYTLKSGADVPQETNIYITS